MNVEVWWAALADARPELVTLLNPVERERREAYRHEADRDRFTLGAVVTRLLLAAETATDPAALPIDRTCECGEEHGRPRLIGSGIEVSVSHSGDRVAVAVGRVPALGVDVELASPPADAARLFPMVLSSAETAEPAAFAAYWTRKEAVLKATGEGLRVPLADLTVTGPELAPALLAFRDRPDLPRRTVLAALDPGPGYLAALAAIDAVDLTVAEHDASDLLTRFVTEVDSR